MGDCGRNCDCNSVSRREFLQIGLGAAAAATAAGHIRSAMAAPGDYPPSAKAPPPREWFDSLIQRGEPPMYTGDALRHVAFPLGGIGTGTVWLHGTGRLVAWQIFNNIDKSTQVDDSFFAIRAEVEGAPPVVRVLQTTAIGPFEPVASARFVGQYPFAFVDFDDPALPVQVRLEAFNPLIPLNEEDSSIPCAMFRVAVTNKGAKPVRVAVLASQQNAVGHRGTGASNGVEHTTYGRNMNRLLRARGLVGVNLSAEPGTGARLDRPLTVYVDRDQLTPEGHWPVENMAVRSVGPTVPDRPTSAVYWISEGDLSRIGGGSLTAIDAAVRSGATLVLSGLWNPLLGEVKATLSDAAREEETFADFEGDSYGAWRAEGEAIGSGPAHGKIGVQNPVSGFLGAGLVNTFNPGDHTKGTLRSRSFVIRRKYISFLIGGGNKPGGCCLNLRVDDRVVRTATGKDAEVLERQEWDVSDLAGKDAVLEIIDNKTVGWGHTLVDDVRFSNLPAATVTAAEAKAWDELLPAAFVPIPRSAETKSQTVAIDRTRPEFQDVTAKSIPLRVAPLLRPAALKDGAKTLLADDDGTPVLFAREHGRGRVFVIPAGMIEGGSGDVVAQRDAWLGLISGIAGVRFRPAVGQPTDGPSFGTMCLTTPNPDATVVVGWTDRDKLHGDFAALRFAEASADRAGPTDAGVSVNAAIVSSLSLPAGGSGDAEFVLTWHFPNQYYPQERWELDPASVVSVGTMYANRYRDAASVATYVVNDRHRLRGETERFRSCLYDSTLPNYFVDCVGANVSILRSPTCFRTKDGTLFGFEGCQTSRGGCCPMNCNHVWNYEHALSMLWPSLERNMRITELEYHQQPDGGIHHRVSVPRDNPNKPAPPVADGQCGAVLKAYREHRQTGDGQFLAQQWPRVRKAMDYAIKTWDSDSNGVMDRPQFNTYDREIFGHNTFVTSLYLAALRAAEEMARIANDVESARRYRALYESGRDVVAKTLFNGEYYIQIADDLTGGYGTGCFSDQVVGQWWARVLDLGDVLPNDQVRSALKSIFKYNWLTSQRGFRGTQRYLLFADGDDKALLIASWPKGGRPADPIHYRDEAWTGVEYQVAAHMLYEGAIIEALAIVRGARERYNGLKRNPWNEIECGDYYVRAMSSWTLLLAAQGCTVDGYHRVLGFDPRLQPDDHRSFFSAAEGWGRFVQKRSGRTQSNRIELAYGQCELAELRLGLPSEAKAATATARVGGRELHPETTVRDGVVVLRFAAPVALRANDALEVALAWS